MLNRADKEGLIISHFVFHILEKDEEDPTFLDEVVLTNNQKTFFSKWLSESINMGNEYEFRNPDHPGGVKSLCSKIRNENEFIESSKQMSSEFKRFHKGSSSDGLLIIALVQLQTGSALFLVKMNYSETLQYDLATINGRTVAVLKEVSNPINESRQAIQKAALINIDSEYEWDVFAQDKQNPISHKIADYFQNFLDVREKEVASYLTRKVFAAVSTWAKRYKADIDPDQNYTDYKGRAYEYLSSSDEFDSEAYINSVISDSDEERRVRLKNSLRSFLADNGLEGRAFEIKRASIGKSQSKITWQTHSDVKISFTGTPESNNIESRTQKNGETVITITTNRVTKT